MADMKPADPVIILLQRISETQTDHGGKLDRAKDEAHEARRTLDVLNERIQPLLNLPSRIGEIEARIGQDSVRITGARESLTQHAERLATLEAQSNQLKGMGKPAGTVFTAIVTALIVAIVAFIAGRGINTNPQPHQAPAYQPQ